MTTVRILIREPITATDEDGNVVNQWPNGPRKRIAPKYDDIDLDRLSPRARALVDAIATSRDSAANEIWVECDYMIRERMPEEQWRMWYGEEKADKYERRPWSAWSRFRADSQCDPHVWLEKQAAKIPAGWHVYGPTRTQSIGEVETELTADQVVESLRQRGMPIKVATWRGYVSRGQAPQPARRIGGKPLWDSDAIAQWKRPGQGARTDLRDNASAEDQEDPGPAAPIAGTAVIEPYVHRAYRSLADLPGALVSLADLRKRLAYLHRPDLDAALIDMYVAQRINLTPRSNQRALTDDERAAGLECGGETKHLISITP